VTVRHAVSTLLALALGGLCAVLVACGGGGDERALIPPARASAMQDELDRIARAVRNGNCDAVSGNVQDLQRQVNRLSNEVDAKLRARLQEGVNNLADIAPDECLDQRTDTQATETTETAPATTPTETTPETTPTETTPETVPTETAPPVETVPPPVETIPPGSGGATVPGQTGGGGTGGVEPLP
jgi:outer membrane murein-binding lipoprotein Lpp